jgi:hypothetical protein
MEVLQAQLAAVDTQLAGLGKEIRKAYEGNPQLRTPFLENLEREQQALQQEKQALLQEKQALLQAQLQKEQALQQEKQALLQAQLQKEQALQQEKQAQLQLLIKEKDLELARLQQGAATGS